MKATQTFDGSPCWGRISWTALAVVLLGTLGAPRAASAQVAASDIPQFVGTWDLPLQAQGQSFEMTIAITEGEDGRAAATVSDQMGDTEVETVSLNEETLELAYSSSFQGTTFPVLITLTPADEGLTVEIDFADGQFFLDGTATRAE